MLNSRGGFTLLEVLVAMAILVMVFGVAFIVQSNSLRATERSRDMGIVAMLAKNLMVETEMETEGRKFEELKEEESGKFESPFERFSWKREIKEIEFPNVVGGSGEGGEDGGDSSGGTREEEVFGRLVSQYLSKAIREIVVTISWEVGEGEQSFSLASYWVDLNTEFQITQ